MDQGCSVPFQIHLKQTQLEQCATVIKASWVLNTQPDNHRNTVQPLCKQSLNLETACAMRLLMPVATCQVHQHQLQKRTSAKQHRRVAAAIFATAERPTWFWITCVPVAALKCVQALLALILRTWPLD